MASLIEEYLTSELDLGEPDAADAVLAALGRDLSMLFFVTEARGTMQDVLVRQMLETRSEAFVQRFKQMVPLSRGGQGRGLDAERDWEAMARAAVNSFGPGFFERVREQIAQYGAEIERLTQKIKQHEREIEQLTGQIEQSEQDIVAGKSDQGCQQ